MTMDNYIHVRVGSGKRIHLMPKGSSVTNCGEWTGTSRIWEVDTDKVTCKHCGGHGEEFPIIKPKTIVENKDVLVGKVIRHPTKGLGIVQESSIHTAYGFHLVSFKNHTDLVSDLEIRKLLGWR